MKKNSVYYFKTWSGNYGVRFFKVDTSKDYVLCVVKDSGHMQGSANQVGVFYMKYSSWLSTHGKNIMWRCSLENTAKFIDEKKFNKERRELLIKMYNE